MPMIPPVLSPMGTSHRRWNRLAPPPGQTPPVAAPQPPPPAPPVPPTVPGGGFGPVQQPGLPPGPVKASAENPGPAGWTANQFNQGYLPGHRLQDGSGRALRAKLASPPVQAQPGVTPPIVALPPAAPPMQANPGMEEFMRTYKAKLGRMSPRGPAY